jgi:hypothetical protein
MLKHLMCSTPVLTQLDFNKKFYIQTDALGYGMGAILSQEGGTNMLTLTIARKQKPTLHLITYYSVTFTPME